MARESVWLFVALALESTSAALGACAAFRADRFALTLAFGTIAVTLGGAASYFLMVASEGR